MSTEHLRIYPWALPKCGPQTKVRFSLPSLRLYHETVWANCPVLSLTSGTVICVQWSQSKCEPQVVHIDVCYLITALASRMTKLSPSFLVMFFPPGRDSKGCYTKTIPVIVKWTFYWKDKSFTAKTFLGARKIIKVSKALALLAGGPPMFDSKHHILFPQALPGVIPEYRARCKSWLPPSRSKNKNKTIPQERILKRWINGSEW